MALHISLIQQTLTPEFDDTSHNAVSHEYGIWSFQYLNRFNIREVSKWFTSVVATKRTATVEIVVKNFFSILVER
ncbi:MAG: hypothetical protein NC548_28220 [Lachnospiraceae bacterium]|nr:hypothetical protein [Lachnospiraceae bacterium]